jgi:hypothetical protein
MPYFLELGSGGDGVKYHSYKGKAIVVNSDTGKHYSTKPIPMEKAKKQVRLLEQIAKKE